MSSKVRGNGQEGTSPEAPRGSRKSKDRKGKSIIWYWKGLKIEPVGTSLLIKAQPIEQKTDRVVMKKATPLSSTTKKKEIAKPIVIKSDEKSKLPLSTKDGKCYHKGFPGGNANEYIQYACDISNYDIDFILTLQHENGSWDYKTQSRVIQKNGKREPSYGFCQMHYSYHKKDVYENLPYDKIFTSKYLNDWKYQMEICRDKYKNGTTFYGYKYRFIGNKGLIYINGKYY